MAYPTAQPLKIKIDGNDRTASIDHETVVITDSLGKAVDTARFFLKNGGGMSLAQAQVVIISNVAEDVRYFGGVITRMTVTERGPFLDYAIECDDFSWYLEHPSDLYTVMHVGDSDQTIIQAAMANAPEIDATASVEEIEADTVYNNFIRETPRRILEYMADLSGGDWYVDWGPGTGGKTADLHYFDAATNTAPYALSDVVADPPADPYPYDKFMRVWDAPDANRVIVAGKNALAVATRTIGAEGDYGRWLTTKLVDDTILTAAQAQAKGDQLLANLVEASTYTCEVKEPGLRSGMTIDVTNGRHSLSAEAFMITRVETRFVGPAGHAIFSLEMGKLQHSLTDILAVKKNLVEDDQYVPKHVGTFEQIDADDGSRGTQHLLTSYNETLTYTSAIKLRKSHTTTVGTNTKTLTNESLGVIEFFGVDDGADWEMGGFIDAIQDGVPNTAVPTKIRIWAYDDTVAGVVAHLTVNGPDFLVEIEDADLAIRSQGELRFYDNGNYVGFEAPALAADQIWVLPSADGNADEVLTTDGGGNLSWGVGGGGFTAGSIIFSDGSGLAEDNANLFWDDTNDELGVGTNTPAGKVHIKQPSASGAIPVLVLEQADVDEAFMLVIGTSADGQLDRSLVEEGDQASATLAGWEMVEVTDNGGQIGSGKYHSPFYTLA